MKDLIEKYVNKTATIKVGGLTVKVLIGDVKLAWNKERYLVTPVAGDGEVWVENVTLIND